MTTINLKTALNGSTIIPSNFSFCSNTYYIIDDNFTIPQNNNVQIADLCILDFQGGSFSGNGTLTFHRTRIIGYGAIFGDNLNFGTGSIVNTEVPVEWFGIWPDSPFSATFDYTASIDRALSFCYATKARVLRFSPGDYYINKILTIGKTKTNSSFNNWEIRIQGAGNLMNYGTCFLMGSDAYIEVDMRNSANGSLRGGGIYDCCFQDRLSRFTGDTQRGTSYAIFLKKADTFKIHNCRFICLEKAIQMQGPCYYTDIRSCIFTSCNYGIKTYNTDIVPTETYDGGACNNNMVYGCMFNHNQGSPLDLTTGASSWHIIDSDIEGDNGTIRLSNNCHLSNVRIERNKTDQNWLEIANNCEIDAEIHGDSITNVWRVLCNGTGNRIRLNFHGYNYCGLISHKQGNEFFINVSTNGTTDCCFVFSPEDRFVLNGYSNKSEYIGTNLIMDTNLCPDTSVPSSSLSCFDGICWPAKKRSSSDTTYKYIKFNMDETKTSLYKTCQFYVTGDAQHGVHLFDGFSMDDDNLGKWLCCATAYINNSGIGDRYPSVGNPKYINLYTGADSDAYSSKVYIRDVVVSTDKPLYQRPILETIEENTYNQWKNDGILHLQRTLVNHEKTTFCLVPDTNLHGRLIVNRLGKIFQYTNSNVYRSGEYVVDGFFKTSTNTGNLEYILQNYLNADVEIRDSIGNRFLRFHAQRSSTSASFTVSVQASDGLTYLNNNSLGTIQIGQINTAVYCWIESLTS